MAKYATKAKENIFTQARYNAAKFNDRLNSREGASEELGIDRSRLARIELGSKNPFPDAIKWWVPRRRVHSVQDSVEREKRCNATPMQHHATHWNKTGA